MLALVAIALVRSTPAPALDGSALPTSVVVVLDDDPEALIEVDVVLRDDQFVAWTTDLGLQTCLHLAATKKPGPHPIESTPPDQIVFGSVCGPHGTLPTDSLTLARSVVGTAGTYGVMALALPDEYEGSDWEVEATPAPSRTVATSTAAALVYDGDDWPDAGTGVSIDVRCDCGSLTSKLDFSRP
jgi:hypothetical protein